MDPKGQIFRSDPILTGQIKEHKAFQVLECFSHRHEANTKPRETATEADAPRLFTAAVPPPGLRPDLALAPVRGAKGQSDVQFAHSGSGLGCPFPHDAGAETRRRTRHGG